MIYRHLFPLAIITSNRHGSVCQGTLDVHIWNKYDSAGGDERLISFRRIFKTSASTPKRRFPKPGMATQ